MKINENFLQLSESYLFSDIARKVKAYKEEHPDADIIRLGIGDVTQPLAPAVIEAMHKAVEEMSHAETFRGYGPEHGYNFLQKAIIEGDFLPRGIELREEEIFINDGAKSDCGNMGDIFARDCVVAVTDPVYPVYVDSNMMAGRKIVFLQHENLVPQFPTEHVDLIYLCYPNNPTGTTLTAQELKKWVDYARKNGSIILYDAAYEAYIQDDNIPHSIYEIEGARECAIEFHSYSKTAGFTGVRCGYTIVPLELTCTTAEDRTVSLNTMWNRRQCTKFNGTSYIQQRAAEAIYTPEGKRQIRETIAYYMENARIMREGLLKAGYEVYGGENAPYIWLRCPEGMTSWQFFQALLEGPHIIGTPGVGFGPAGEGYFRLTAFGKREDCIKAMARLTSKQ